jgi:DNA modification methylase
MPITPIVWPTPYWQTSDEETIRLYQGDVRSILDTFPSRSVQCIVTSPPYWKLRNYLVKNQIGLEHIPDCETYGQVQCGQCYVCTMVGIFRQLKRILRNDGTLWLNLGDTYTTPGENRNGLNSNSLDGSNKLAPVRKHNHGNKRESIEDKTGLRDGNLLGIPWRVALALQKDRWILRNDVIWGKPNPMPESVTNRCTKAHEYLFLFTKTNQYYFDMGAIKEKQSINTLKIHNKRPSQIRGNKVYSIQSNRNDGGYKNKSTNINPDTNKNKRSVWTVEEDNQLLQWLSENKPEILQQFLDEQRNNKDVWSVASQPYRGAHFATFPEKLIRPCILAGSSEKGCCPHCKSPWERKLEVATERIGKDRGGNYKNRSNEPGIEHQSKMDGTKGGYKPGMFYPSKTIGWRSTCNCEHTEDELIPCTILDPFMGSGTTTVVSLEHERNSVGIELSEEYIKNQYLTRVIGKLSSKPYTRNLVPTIAK